MNKHILEVERAVVKGVLEGKQSTLTALQFFGLDNAMAFKSLTESGDKLLTINKLEEAGQYEGIGGDTYFETVEATDCDLEKFEEYEDIVKQAYLTRKYKNLGTEIHNDPEKAETILSSFYDELKQLTKKSDDWYSLEDAINTEFNIEYLVENLFEMGSLNMLYGAPESFKSFVLMDMMLAVASGTDWLPPDDEVDIPALGTVQVPTLWVDCDQGKRRICERLKALVNAKNIDPASVPFYFSPLVGLNMSSIPDTNELIDRAKEKNIGFIVIDNLGTTSGGINENSPEMIPVMFNFRRLAEATGAAVCIIHHPRKQTGFSARKGESVRGHTSIEAALDWALFIERDKDDVSAKMISTKSRGGEIAPISFRYACRKEDNTLVSAEFFRLKEKIDRSNYSIKQRIIEVVEKNGPSKKGTIVSETQAIFKAAEIKVGVNKIRGLIDELAHKDKLLFTETGRTKIYRTPFFAG